MGAGMRAGYRVAADTCERDMLSHSIMPDRQKRIGSAGDSFLQTIPPWGTFADAGDSVDKVGHMAPSVGTLGALTGSASHAIAFDGMAFV